MKLELKHLAPYLPYGLKVMGEDGDLYDLTGLTGTYGVFKNIKYSKVEDQINKCKPILKPISDLGKQAPKTVSRIRFVDEINKPCMYMLDRHGDFYDLPESMEVADVYETFEGLFKYHFDVFGLIDAGLAIDINTLSNEKV